MGGISRINVLDNGPLVAEGLENLGDSKGDDLEIKKGCALQVRGARQQALLRRLAQGCKF